MREMSLSVGVVIPTLNARALWPAFHAGLQMQTLPLKRILIVDTSSTDGTADAAREAGYDVISVERSDFNHGKTRQRGAALMSDVDVIVYLTQDAILASPDSLFNLLTPFLDPSMGAVYGRQLPRLGAGILEAHARLFNYPETSVVRDLERFRNAGFKAVFSSNSFAAYRTTALGDVGGFPLNVVVSEETLVFARLLLKGWKTAYVGDATVYHSHEYTAFQSLQRYFDIGVMHARERWIIEEFGKVGSEGRRFLLSELRALWPDHLYLLPTLFIHTAAKLLGYQLGLRERFLGVRIARYFSQQKSSWV